MYSQDGLDDLVRKNKFKVKIDTLKMYSNDNSNSSQIPEVHD